MRVRERDSSCNRGDCVRRGRRGEPLGCDRSLQKPLDSEASTTAVGTSAADVGTETELDEEDHSSSRVKQAQSPSLKLLDPSPMKVADEPPSKAGEPPAMVNPDEA